MKLYNENYPAPNPRKVRIFLAEKGLSVDLVHVPMRERAHKAAEFLAKNALGQLPVLETDDGQFISESLAICRYLEELHPAKPLFGTRALEKAMIEMWIKRVEFRLWAPMSQAWRNDDPRTEAVVKMRFPEFGAYSRTQVERGDELDRSRAWRRAGVSRGRRDFRWRTSCCCAGLILRSSSTCRCRRRPRSLRRWHAAVSARPTARA